MTPSTTVNVESTKPREMPGGSRGPPLSHVFVKVVVKAVEERALGEEIAQQQIGDAERGDEGIGEHGGVPNMKAKICSRTTPIRREAMTEMPTTSAERFVLRFFGAGAPIILGMPGWASVSASVAFSPEDGGSTVTSTTGRLGDGWAVQG